LTAGSLSRFIFALSLAIAAMFSWSYLFLILLIVFSVAAALAWGAKLNSLFRTFRYSIFLVLFVFVLHLFSHPGQTIFSIYKFDATIAGAIAGAYYSLKLFVFAFTGAILFFTVDPQKLISPLERLARHTGPLGKPLESFALTMFLALRFLPEMTSLGNQTALAFKTKGIDFRGGPMHKARVSTLIMAPLFVTAFKRTELTAAALDIKGYGTRHSRAVLAPINISLGGTIVLLISIVIIIAGWRTR
jgi:energy-coupling factor transport system permease protein